MCISNTSKSDLYDEDIIIAPGLVPGPRVSFKARPQLSPVGIIGAGTAGLYAALILESFAIPYDMSKVHTGIQVTRIALNCDKRGMIIDVKGDVPRRYQYVISTVPLSCLRSIDTIAAALTYEQNLAMRCCHYDVSTKVGIKFRTRW